MSAVIIAAGCCCNESQPSFNCCGTSSQPVPTPPRARVIWTGSITVTLTGCSCDCARDCASCIDGGDTCRAMSGSGQYGGGVIAEGDLLVNQSGEGDPGCSWYCRYEWDVVNLDPRHRSEFLVSYPPGNCTYAPCPPPCAQFPPYPCVPWQPSALTRYVGINFGGIYPLCDLNRWAAFVRPAFGAIALTGSSIPGPCNVVAYPQDGDLPFGFYVGPTIERCPSSGIILPSSMFGTYGSAGWNWTMEPFCQGGNAVLSPGSVIVSAA